VINILHLTPWPLGGATSYVVNLAKTFEAAGVPHRVLRLGKRTEAHKREIGKFGVFYRNVSFEDAKRAKGSFLLASAPTDAIRATEACFLVGGNGGAFVFHDPNEMRIYPHWRVSVEEQTTVICIREAGLNWVRANMENVPKSCFIPHPYVRWFESRTWPRRKMAVSIARTSAVKKSDWILEANAQLPAHLQVDLRGEVNRMWWNFNIKPKHPEWPYPAQPGFPRTDGAAVGICREYELMVDLTIFKDDGGGTQYSLLEAMDAGAVPVMSADWCSYPGVARELGFQVSNASSLWSFLSTAGTVKMRKAIAAKRAANYTYLDRVHNPEAIAAQYTKALGV
jgi:hypothetical protein